MTRKEEIQKAADEYNGLPFAGYLNNFTLGAEWADRHPDKQNVYTKKELFDMGFTFDLNGNIASPEEERNAMKEFLAYTKKQWIEKACKWLEENLLNYWQQASTDNRDFIEDFHKAMEQ